MTKRPDITTVSQGYYGRQALNANFENLQAGFDNTLSLDGSAPNAMAADLDMNSNDILNAGNLSADTLTLNGQLTGPTTTAFDWKGDWTTGTDYKAYDTVANEGSSYVCVEDHTSSALFPSDSAKWNLLASVGATGAGTGDMLGALNLSDVADPATSRLNLGLGTMAEEAAADYPTLAGDNTLSGANTVSLADGEVGAPSLSFNDDVNTGFFSPSNNSVAMVTAGQYVMRGKVDQTLQLYGDLEFSDGSVQTSSGLGSSQTWQDVRASRAVNTSYQNTTGKPIQVVVEGTTSGYFEVSDDNTNWVVLSILGEAGNFRTCVSAVVPDQHYYRQNGGSLVSRWSELR